MPLSSPSPQSRLRFRTLLVDINGDSVIQTEDQLLFSALSNAKLWKAPELKRAQRIIVDGTTSFSAAIVEPDEDLQGSFARAFVGELSGTYSDIEALRLRLL